VGPQTAPAVEAWFLSAAHEHDALSRIADALPRVASRAAAAISYRTSGQAFQTVTERMSREPLHCPAVTWGCPLEMDSARLAMKYIFWCGTC
jgi:hypothetical protein